MLNIGRHGGSVGRHGGSVGRGLCVTTYPLAWRLRRGDPLFVSGYTTARNTECWPATAALLHFGALACVFCVMLPPKPFLPVTRSFF